MTSERFVQAAYAYLFIGDYHEVKAAFQRAIAAEPNNSQLYFHASITAHRNGDLQEAHTLATKAVSLCPENDLYRSNVAAIYASVCVEHGKSAYFAGRTVEAFQYFRLAQAADPLNEEADTFSQKLKLLHPEVEN